MSKFTDWSKKYGVPVWVFFVVSGVVVILILKILSL
ncbi:hypothetical protein LCGC14_1539880 [marine sediment metagenome]|uniref:Uncharacterized protein n=1 Tax=marine sediment metagenome TaxID=412755 RepID=A0A0F9L9E5_9ZZZZ